MNGYVVCFSYICFTVFQTITCVAFIFSKKTSPARRDSSTSGQKLTQGKISDYVKTDRKSVMRSSSRRMSEDSTSSSKNGPTTKPSSQRQRARDSSEESSDRKPSPVTKRQSSLSSLSRSSSPPTKRSTTVNR